MDGENENMEDEDNFQKKCYNLCFSKKVYKLSRSLKSKFIFIEKKIKEKKILNKEEIYLCKNCHNGIYYFLLIF